MKNFAAVIALIALIAAPSVQAEDWRQRCSSMGELAKTIMEKRQSGIFMETIMQVIDENDNGPTMKFTEELIISAYETPLCHTEETKRLAIREFQNKAYLKCVKIMRAQKNR